MNSNLKSQIKSLKFSLWLAFKIIGSDRKWILDFNGWTTLLSLSIGVASLVVSMAVFSGFESTLTRSIIDVTGDLQIQISNQINEKEAQEKVVTEVGPQMLAIAQYSVFEAIAAKSAKISGVAIQAIDTKQIDKVLALKNRLVEGSMIEPKEFVIGEMIPAVVGKSLARKFGLKVGDSLRIVVPQWDEFNPSQFKRIVGNAVIQGIADFGKFELDERVVVIDLQMTREWLKAPQLKTGFLVKLKKSENAKALEIQLEQNLGPGYRIKSWTEMNANLLEAVKNERVVVFFILLVIVIAAAFNVFTTLTVLVLKKTSQWSLLKALGAPQTIIFQILSLLGLIIGGLGWLGGMILGLFFCFIFMILEKYFHILPSDVYKLTEVQLAFRWQDFLSITGATFIICFVAALAPGLKASQLNPSEGVRNE